MVNDRRQYAMDICVICGVQTAKAEEQRVQCPDLGRVIDCCPNHHNVPPAL